MQSASGIASLISEGDIFIYSCSAQLICFEIKSISKEVNCAEHKYMNMPPSLVELVTPLQSANVLMSTEISAISKLAQNIAYFDM